MSATALAPHAPATIPAPLAAFVHDLSTLLRDGATGPDLLDQASAALERLLIDDRWLPDAYARPDPVHYRQYLLYRDPAERFSVVSFVWGPGQKTPIHDHTVWGLVGLLRGAEYSQRYVIDAAGVPRTQGAADKLLPGQVEILTPEAGDIHEVSNALPDAVSVSIHVYGADIGKVQRWVYPATGGTKPFISGYSNGPDTPAFTLVPHLEPV